MNQNVEPILDEANRRFTAFPIKYPDIWESYEKQLASFWRATEIDFSKDYNGFQQLSENEQFYIKRILAFFASSDGIVNFNITTRFLNEITIIEAIICYQYQITIENIHNHSYSIMLDNLIKNQNEKDMLLNSIKEVPSIKMIADWSFKWIDSDLPFSYRVIAFAVIEGIIFSGAFASIFWLKSQKGGVLMDGLIQSNEFIARDESEHTLFAIKLYKHLKNPLSFSEVCKVIDEGLEIAKNFMSDALPVKLISMNSEKMCDYLEYVADCLYVNLGYTKRYNKQNPFPFMDLIGVNQKPNFFETRPTQYQSAYGGERNASSDLNIVDDF